MFREEKAIKNQKEKALEEREQSISAKGEAEKKVGGGRRTKLPRSARDGKDDIQPEEQEESRKGSAVQPSQGRKP